LNDPSDHYRLLFTKELSVQQKLAHYRSPDYCLVTRFNTLKLLRHALEPLVSRGGLFYSIFAKVEAPGDLMVGKTRLAEDVMMVVLYFSDSEIDLMAEILGVQCRLASHDTQLPYKSYAADMFEQFNSRQH